ncbi:restriction endonuclease subunit S [Luteolibacter sp. Populi]|uniref:restriction endonuclease subunit S n=1 Tax=Luteolibacter sp. Populi TaxID=3230487 RepID=UPI0034675CCA
MAGDILYGKLRPYLNKVGIAPQAGLCSTEIWAFGPSPLVDSKFAAFFLASSFFVERVVSMTKGANLPRLDAEDFDSIEMPLPPLSEQKRIVEILQEADEIRDLRAQAEAKTADLIPAMFFEHFVARNQHGFVPLYKLADAVSGVAVGRKTRGMTSEVSYLRVANVQAGYVDLDEVKTTLATDGEVAQFGLMAGDILLTEGGDFDKLGRGCLWEGQVEPCIHQNHVFRVRPDSSRLNSHFFAHYLQSAKAKNYFLRCAKKTTNLASINLSQLKQLPVPDVSLEDQLRFEDQIREAQQCGTASTDKLFRSLVDSLSAHAFSGELTAKWREANSSRLDAEVHERDQTLKSTRGRIAELLTHGTATSKATASLVLEDHADGIYSDLNREQWLLFGEIKRMVGGSSYIRYFNARMLGEYLRTPPLRKNPQAIEGHLAVLAVRGLLIPVSREEQTEDTGEYLFGNAYRLVLKDRPNEVQLGGKTITFNGEPITMGSEPGDLTRLREMERLIGQLEKERAQK